MHEQNIAKLQKSP